LTEALYRVLSTPHYTIKCQASYGTIPELAFTLAIKATNIQDSSLVAAARESFVCRTRDEKKTRSYGSELSFRDALPDSFKKVTVSGKLVGNGGEVFSFFDYRKVSVQVGSLFFRISKPDIERICPLNDFKWANRPYASNHGTDCGKTGGVLQYILYANERNVCVKGLTIPLISESDSAPVLISGKKSQVKVLKVSIKFNFCLMMWERKV
jgi:hypothetical protein